MTVRIITADVLDGLAQLESESIHCVVTSPPYWGLRDYGTSGQIGLEPTPEAYVAKMVEVFREVRRVLRKDGTLWLNLGDCYIASAPGNKTPSGISQIGTDGMFSRKMDLQIGHGEDRKRIWGMKKDAGLKPKDLAGIPWRVAFALQADGWWLRQDIIWSKPNPMPESIKDRCTKAHEYLFMLTKAERYHYDADAIAEPVTDSTVERLSQPTLSQQEGSWRVPGKTNGSMKAVGTPRNDGNRWNGNNGRGFVKRDNERYQDRGESYYTRNKRSVWEITTQPFPEAHFATFPPALVEPCILAGCPKEGLVLDPFAGSGTTGLVADRLKRSAILIELNPEYAAMAERRIRGDCPMFTEVNHVLSGDTAERLSHASD